jgi:hypothetical protein
VSDSTPAVVRVEKPRRTAKVFPRRVHVPAGSVCVHPHPLWIDSFFRFPLHPPWCTTAFPQNQNPRAGGLTAKPIPQVSTAGAKSDPNADCIQTISILSRAKNGTGSEFTRCLSPFVPPRPRFVCEQNGDWLRVFEVHVPVLFAVAFRLSLGSSVKSRGLAPSLRGACAPFVRRGLQAQPRVAVCETTGDWLRVFEVPVAPFSFCQRSNNPWAGSFGGRNRVRRERRRVKNGVPGTAAMKAKAFEVYANDEWLIRDSRRLLDQEADQPSQQRFTPLSDVVNELEESQIQGQLLLRNPTVGTQP